MFKTNEKNGMILVLPQLNSKDTFVLSFVDTFLVEHNSNLFPSHERKSWIHESQYELPKVRILKEQKKQIETDYNRQLLSIATQIHDEYKSQQWQHDLLTETDNCLVKAVISALTFLGFDKVTNVDEEMDAKGKARREDLQIADRDPITIICDIKGISGLPKDEDILQSTKHAIMRMKEWNNTRLRSLSIINHQKTIAPHIRNNTSPFRKEILDVVDEYELSLITTWDLFSMVISASINSWPRGVLVNNFYRNGRVSIIPSHYIYIGKIAHVWTGRFGLVLEGTEIKLGDTLALEHANIFNEHVIHSMQIKSTDVNSAHIGDQVAIMFTPSIGDLREGILVYKRTT